MNTLETIDLTALNTVTGGKKLPPPSTFKKAVKVGAKVVDWAGTAMNYAFMADMAYEGGSMAYQGGKALYNYATGKKQPAAPAQQPIEE